MAEIHKDDIGTVFKLTIVDQAGAVVDVSSDPSPEIKFRVSSQEITRVASFTTDGTDGVIQYTSVSGDLTPIGNWTMQGHVDLTAGEWHTTIVPFKVLDIIE
jgi:hypothetical protein